jgi:antitoxin YefM
MTMDAMTYTAFRAKLAQKMKEICENHLGVIVTRKNHETVVVLSLEDYRAMEETAYLLTSPANAKRLMESIKNLQEGKTFERELLEE